MTVLDKLAHLPATPWQGLRLAWLNRQARHKVESGFFRDRLILATYVEKSANTLICDCIARLQAELGPDRPSPGSSYGQRRQPAWVPAFDDHALRPELVLYKPEGGVVNRMFPPSPSNLQILDWLQLKYFVILRHPADQVCALFTYIPERVTAAWANNPIFTVPWSYYDGSLDRDQVPA